MTKTKPVPTTPVKTTINDLLAKELLYNEVTIRGDTFVVEEVRIASYINSISRQPYTTIELINHRSGLIVGVLPDDKFTIHITKGDSK